MAQTNNKKTQIYLIYLENLFCLVYFCIDMLHKYLQYIILDNSPNPTLAITECSTEGCLVVSLLLLLAFNVFLNPTLAITECSTEGCLVVSLLLLLAFNVFLNPTLAITECSTEGCLVVSLLLLLAFNVFLNPTLAITECSTEGCLVVSLLLLLAFNVFLNPYPSHNRMFYRGVSGCFPLVTTGV